MIRRAFLGTINYDHPQRGMEHAFQSLLGKENVQSFDYYELERRGKTKAEINEAFIKAATAFKPDWVWLQVQDGDILTADSLLAIRRALPTVVISHWNGDMRRNVSPYNATVCKAAHLTLISSMGQVELFEAAGAKLVRYCQVAVDWEEDVLGSQSFPVPFKVPDVVFIGHYYANRYPGTPERERAITALMKAEIPVGIVGNGWPKGYPVLGNCKLKEQIHVWRKAKIGLNVNHFNDVSCYYSDRQLVSMVSGKPLVCKYIPDLETEFINGKHLYWYKDEQELVQRVQALLENPVLAKTMGQAGRSLVLRNHTWFARFVELIPVVEGLIEDLKGGNS
jgi:hypothetical protein